MRSGLSDSYSDLSNIAKTISHPIRLQIVDHLSASGVCSSSELHSLLPLSRGSVNQHLSVLRDAKWVDTVALGAQVGYQLNFKKFTSDTARLRESLDLISGRVGRSDETVSQKRLVLFLCIGNSCRSQMAEAFFNTSAGETSYIAASAGTLPANGVHQDAVEVMSEVGIDISNARPKGVDQFLGVKAVDFVVFVCSEAEKNCPYLFPFARRTLKMPFDDPASFDGGRAETLSEFRRVRDLIKSRVDNLIEEIYF